ncbi:MAG: hypothetical protein JJV93_02750 [Alphaproteobacteria bacterium]|nr:hypothetical protein [Alphaproteobacteria bacterium]MBL0718148.1 hypothetical protein [Alphaproteobacteria bacterium]
MIDNNINKNNVALDNNAVDNKNVDGNIKSNTEYNIKSDILEDNSDINKRLIQAGLDNKQAQEVYNIIEELVLPELEKMSQDDFSSSEVDKIVDFFGSQDAWNKVADKLEQWGNAFLEPDEFKLLASSARGIMSMYYLMNAQEPDFNDNPDKKSAVPTEKSLKKIMQDPQYWREHNPEVVRKVDKGFAILYGKK